LAKINYEKLNDKEKKAYRYEIPDEYKKQINKRKSKKYSSAPEKKKGKVYVNKKASSI